MDGTLKDWKHAEELANNGRPQDAIGVIDKMLGIADREEIGDRIDLIKELMDSPDDGLCKAMSDVVDTGDGKAMVSFKGDLLPVSHDHISELIELRARCFYMDAKTRPAGQQVSRPWFENAIFITELFPNNPDLLCLAALPWLFSGDIDEVGRILGRALHFDPDNQLAQSIVEDANRQGLALQLVPPPDI